MKTRARKAFDWVLNLVVASAVLLAVAVFLAPRWGVHIHPVLSGSMEPALGIGGIIITKLTPVEQVRVGDIITYRVGDQRVTHRVVSIATKDGKISFQTKGDANENADPYSVAPKGERVAKVVYYFPYAGFVAGFMNDRLHFAVAVGSTATVLLALYLLDIWREVRVRRHETAKR